MKFLVLALCVCAASAASVGYKPWQAVQRGAQASAQAVVTVPEVIEPIARTTFVEPAAKAYSASKNVGSEVDASIVRSDSDVAADGFTASHETSNGIAAQTSGTLKKVGDTDFLVIQGSYRYVQPDGTVAEVSYIADENGFQPQSNLLPVGPAIPEAILRSLEYLRLNPQKPEIK